MVVYIATHRLQLMLNHACSTYPEECCGFLLGIDSEHRRIHRAYAVQNVNKGSRQNRFNINPMDLVRADDETRRSNIDLIGIYHSHPDAPVQPSQVDLENAWPWYTYLIVSLQNGAPRDMAAWLLSEDRSTFNLDDLRVAQA